MNYIPNFDEDDWPMLEDFELDWRDAPQFQEGLHAVENYMKNIKENVTIGALARQFPEHQRFLIDILDYLRGEEVVNFVDYKPFPTKVEVV